MARLFQVFVALLFAVFAVEAFFRLIIFPEYKALQEDTFQRHPVLGHFNRPNLELRRLKPGNYDTVVHTNAMGLRGTETDLKKELSGIWIGGDSNTFAAGVEDTETYVHRLREAGYQTANIASEGHNLSSQALLLRYLAAEGYTPRAVVIGVSLYQGAVDLTEAQYTLAGSLDAATKNTGSDAKSTLLSGLRRFGQALPTSLRDVRAVLITNSATYGWLRLGMLNVPAIYNWMKDSGLRSDLNDVVSTDLDFLRPLDEANPATVRISSTADFAKQLGNWVKMTWDVPFGIILFPAYHQMYPERFRLKDSSLDPMRPLTALTAALKRNGVAVLDLLPALKASQIGSLVFPDDAHLNATSHDHVAKVVAHWLETELSIMP